ncbi:phage Gp37/Gp68 family protein [Phyllobacterium sp. LjRoot231]|uniref:phage Gp37/Gp68 family protein n=1 Tax=Phyllobacterium sp. LjRoot231 TaxID=3342289 RepID=UPI003ED15587
MAENSAIEWCDHTFNPWEGCQKVSPGCDHCYAEARNQRFGGGTATNWGPGAPRRRTSASNWSKPHRWQRDALEFYGLHGRRQRVFCSSLADVFDNAVDPSWRADLWQLIRDTPALDWQLLTKRPQNIKKMLPPFWDEIRGHVWLGTSTEDQPEADRRVIHLTAVEPRPAVLFLSMEPFLSGISFRWATWHPIGSKYLTNHLDGLRKLDWIIVGGESGPHARPLHPDWVRMIRDQCKEANVPFLFKQWGEWKPLAANDGHWPIDGSTCIRLTAGGERIESGWPFQRIGKKAAGRHLDGMTHDAFPKVPQT